MKKLSEVELPLVVHVRLGDYKIEKNIGILSPEYYKNALEQIWDESQFNRIWVFSDEIELAKKFIPEIYHHKVNWFDSIDGSTISTFEVMRYGKGYVIANSTYSWWAAMLSYCEWVKVVCPEPWYVGQNSPLRIIPGNWQTVSRF